MGDGSALVMKSTWTLQIIYLFENNEWSVPWMGEIYQRGIDSKFNFWL